MPLLLDFESRSRANLKTVGGRNYWADPSTEALCCVAYQTESHDVLTWTPGDDTTSEDIAQRAYEFGWGAQNATGFDRFAMVRLGWAPLDAPWIDTSELARTAGLPGALDALASRWLGLAKDKVASAYTKSLSRASRARATRGQLPTPDLDRVVRYCASDVEILAHGWPLLEPWLELEPDVVRVDRAINDRGIGFDVQLARRLLELDAQLADRTVTRVARELGATPAEVRTVVGSPAQFAEWTGLSDAQKQTIDEALAGTELSPGARALCEARQAIASIARGKLEAGLVRVSADGRLRDNLRYYGAHTGRWSGRGMQVQNFPRPAKEFESWEDDDLCWLADHVLAGGDVPHAGYVDLLLRATLVPRPGHVFAARDFTGVESRALAWLAGDTLTLEAIAAGRDMYKVDAAAVFGVPYEAIDKTQRQAGKVATLALGYQGGPGALERFARANGVNLAASGKKPGEIVAAWRGAHAPTVRFWHACQSAFAAAVRGETSTIAGCEFAPLPSANGVAIWLPSGRPVVYNDTALAWDDKRRPQLSYLGTHCREYVYGGKIVENLIQALCRDLMSTAMVAAEDGGLPVVLTVHDEIVAEVPANAAREAEDALARTMVALPPWAAGFPIAASGFTGRRYRK